MGKVSNGGDHSTSEYTVRLSGEPFNDAYRYVDWLLTVPLLLIELILVMQLPKAETVGIGHGAVLLRCVQLGSWVERGHLKAARGGQRLGDSGALFDGRVMVDLPRCILD